MSDGEERERGILTPQDREFLRGEREDISEGSKYNTRRRIRQRTEDAILDFSLLLEGLTDRDRERIFTPRERFVPTRESDDVVHINPETSVPPALKQALIDAIAFLYGASVDAEIFPRIVIEEGVREAYSHEHPERALRNVDLTMEWDVPEDVLDTALYNLQEGRELSPPQIRALMEADEISDEELLEIREHVRNSSKGSGIKRDLQNPPEPRIGPSPKENDEDSSPGRSGISDVLSNAPTLDELQDDVGDEE